MTQKQYTDGCDSKARSLEGQHEDLLSFCDVRVQETLDDLVDFDLFEMRRRLLVFAYYEGRLVRSGADILKRSTIAN